MGIINRVFYWGGPLLGSLCGGGGSLSGTIYRDILFEVGGGVVPLLGRARDVTRRADVTALTSLPPFPPPGKRPKKGLATAKQRLGRILKIHRNGKLLL